MKAKKQSKKVVKGIRSTMPKDIVPMSMSLAQAAFNSKDWIYEVKWDGFRCLAYSSGKNVELRSKKNDSFSNKFPAIWAELAKLNLNVVFDGEIVFLDANGRPNFNKLLSGQQDGLVYYVFDILWFNGYDIRNVPLIERRKLLKSILPKSPVIRFSDHFSGTQGKELYNLAEKLGIEGIVAKRIDSLYKSNGRTSAWLKIKTGELIEGFIAGYVIDLDKPELGFSSLLIGKENVKGYEYIGNVEIGVSPHARKKIIAAKTLKKSIFSPEPKVNRKTAFNSKIKNPKVVWIKSIRCRVKFLELDPSGIMRHPSFKGIVNR